MSEEELRQRLIVLGQGPHLSGAPIWNLDKIKTLDDVAALRKGDGDGESADSESVELPSAAVVRRTDWSQAEMRTFLKRCVYIVEAGQFFAEVDKHAAGNYANRAPLYPGWGIGGDSSSSTPEGGYALDRAALLDVIADHAKVVEGNKNYPWSIPAEDLLAGQLDAAQYSDDDVRIVCRELVYFKQTTVPSMWEGKAGAETEFASPIAQ